jgi:hypothetical protein
MTGPRSVQTFWGKQIFAVAARDFDWPSSPILARRYVDYLARCSSAIGTDPAGQVHSRTTAGERTVGMPSWLLVADALMGQGTEGRRARDGQFAQVLADRNTPAAAAVVFRSLIADPRISEGRTAEALGGLGRCTSCSI